MSIQAQTPDGVIHQFPDGTPDAVVDGAIKAYLTQKPAPSTPPANENVFQKAARLTGEAYGAASDAYKRDTQAFAAEVNAGKAPGVRETWAPMLDAVGAALSPLKGVADATFGDKPVALPFGINSKGLTGGDIATMLIPGVGEVAETANAARLAKSAGTTVQTARNTLAASRASAVPAAAPAASSNALADTVQKFDRARVRPSLAAATGGGNATVANSIAENALAGGAARANMAGQVADVQASAKRIGQVYGDARGPQGAGEAVQSGVKTFAQDKDVPTSFAAKADALYDKAFGALDTAMAGKTQPAKTATVLTEGAPVKVQVGGSQISTPATTAALTDMSAAQSKAIGSLIQDPTMSKIAGALTDANAAKDMSFQDLRALRTKVRLAQGNDQLRQDIGAANLQRLEGALTQDIYSNAAKLGSPQLMQQLQRADRYYALGSQRIETALQPFANAKSGENAYQRILNMAGSGATADGRSIISLKRSLAPDEWGDVSSTLINEMGKPNPGAANANDADAFSLGNFVTRYAKLSDQGKNALFGSLGGGGQKASQLKAELDNLVDVAGKVKAVEKGANVSKSGVSAQNITTLSGLGGAAGAALLGHPAGLVSAGGILGSMNVTGRVLTSPEAVRWLARIGKADQVSPAALSSTVGRLRVASVANPRLAPLYQQAAALMRQGTAHAPAGTIPAAATTSQEPATQ